MKVGNEIRIKVEEGISDELAMVLVSKVVFSGKISANGDRYCYATKFEYEGKKYVVSIPDYSKTDLFYVYRDIEEK